MEHPADVDEYIDKSEQWPDEMRALRKIILGTGLTEEVKWGKPCYSRDEHNVVIMQEMKHFLALMFFKGVLLKDPAGVLEPNGPNSRSAMRMTFTSTDDVADRSGTLTDYLAEAIEIADAGLEVEHDATEEFCEELDERLASDDTFREAFEGLTPGRQREYNLHFSSAKKAETRLSRIEKLVPKILEGKGFRDR